MGLLKVSEQDRREWAEMRREWHILVIACLLLAGPLLIKQFLGNGWQMVAAILAALIWFVSRPWKMGLLHPKSRRIICISGSMLFCTALFWALSDYWRN